LNVRVLGVDPTCILGLQRFVDLLCISTDSFKLAVFGSRIIK
jgi:hypothetical protein